MKIETTFNPGEKIWAIHESKAVQATIKSTDINMGVNSIKIRHWCKTSPDAEGFFMDDIHCYRTREELIENL